MATPNAAGRTVGEIAGLEVVDLVVEDFDTTAQAVDFGRVLLDHRRVLLRDQLDLVDRLVDLVQPLVLGSGGLI